MDAERWQQLIARPSLPHAFSAMVPAHIESKLLHQIAEKAWEEQKSLGSGKARNRRRLTAIRIGALWLASMLIPDPRVKDPAP
jgi:hypothetical protein